MKNCGIDYFHFSEKRLAFVITFTVKRCKKGVYLRKSADLNRAEKAKKKAPKPA